MAAKKKTVAKKRPTTRTGERSSASIVAAAKHSGKGKAKAVPAPAAREKVVRVSAAARGSKVAVQKAGAPKPKAPAAGATAGKAAKATKASPAVKSTLAVPSRTLSAGDGAPSFELPDQGGASVSSAVLAGHPYVLYFYPKDDTPGCTTQACGFRDASSEFESLGVRVIGVSPDSVGSHQKFVAKYGLPFTLLSDASQKLAAAYGVWSLKKNYGREYMGIVRSTFLVDGEGVVRKVWRSVRVNGHVAEVQAAAAELS